MNIAVEDTCTFCNNAPETLLHLFWNCEVSKHFWAVLLNYINNKCNTNLIEWNAYDVLFGGRNQDTCISNILLQAKYYLYCNKIKKQLPSIEVFSKHMVTYYQIEKYISAKNFQIAKFEALWEEYKNLFISA